MAVVKLTSSKKSVQFVDDEGNVFYTSVYIVEKMLKGEIRGDFVLLTRMPSKVAEGRFMKSPVFDAVSKTKQSKDEVKQEEYLTASSDPYSVDARKRKEEVKMYSMDVKL
jgi:hypothetical protein